MNIAPWLSIATLTLGLVCASPVLFAEEAEVATVVAVQTSKIINTHLNRYVMAYGMVEPEPEQRGKAAASAKIAAPTTGILAQVHCEEGQHVNKGDLLFELDTRSTDALIAKAQVAVDFAHKNFARKQALKLTENVSRKLYDEAEQQLQNARKELLNAQTQRALLQIRAPLSGTVARIHFKVGEAVNLATVMAEVINLARLDVAITVPSPEVAAIRLKQPVVISAGKALQSKGMVTFIGAQVDPLTDTVLVRAALNNETGLRAGQLVSARILVETRAGRLAVPIASVVTRDGSSVIAVVEGDHAKQVAVTLGLREAQLIEVAGDTLREGMEVVTQGAYGLPAETQIRVLK